MMISPRQRFKIEYRSHKNAEPGKEGRSPTWSIFFTDSIIISVIILSSQLGFLSHSMQLQQQQQHPFFIIWPYKTFQGPWGPAPALFWDWARLSFPLLLFSPCLWESTFTAILPFGNSSSMLVLVEAWFFRTAIWYLLSLYAFFSSPVLDFKGEPKIKFIPIKKWTLPTNEENCERRGVARGGGGGEGRLGVVEKRKKHSSRHQSRITV